MPKRLDLTGERYGRLTVIGEAEQQGYTRRWHCVCDCGNKVIANQNLLRTNRTQSCGCLQKERIIYANVKDLTKKKFGKLTVIKRSERKSNDGKVFWVCECKCGNVVEVLSSSLLSEETKSCGCARSDGGRNLSKYNMQNLTNDGVFTPKLKSKVRSDSGTGVKGVSLVKGKYRAMIGVKGKKHYLGAFETLEEAKEARKRGEEKYHKPYLKEDKS